MLKALSQLRQWWNRNDQSYVGASIENPNVPLDDWYEGFDNGGYNSEAGQKVTHQTMLRIPAFWMGVDLLSADVAKIPLEVYKGTKRTNDVDKRHPANNVVCWQANPDQSAFEFWRQMMINRLIWNNAYAYIERNGAGQVTGLYPLLPDRTRCNKINDGRLVYRSEVDRKIEYFDSYDVLHLRGMCFDGRDAINIIKYMRNSIGKIIAREKFASKFFARGGRLGGVLQIPYNKDKTVRDKIEKGFRQSYESPEGSFKVVVLRENAQFHAAQASFRDTQMIEPEKQDVKTVARILKIPPHKLGDDSKSAHNSLEQENKSYINSSLSSHLCCIASECRLKLFSKTVKSNNSHFFQHTVDALLWTDSKTRATIASTGVSGGWMTRNEARQMNGLSAVDGGDELLIPSGMVQLDDDKPEDDPDADQENDETDETETDEGDE